MYHLIGNMQFEKLCLQHELNQSCDSGAASALTTDLQSPVNLTTSPCMYSTNCTCQVEQGSEGCRFIFQFAIKFESEI